MSDRSNVQLAIGYGLGAGLFAAGVLFVIGHAALSFLDVGSPVLLLGALISIGGVAIAVVNALKLDRTVLSTEEEGDSADAEEGSGEDS